jgi:hypothetical protein
MSLISRYLSLYSPNLEKEGERERKRGGERETKLHSVMTSYNSRGIGDGVFFVVCSRAI